MLVYRASGYTNLAGLLRGSAPQGRQAIGSGSAAETVYYTVSGNQVTIYTPQSGANQGTANEGFKVTTTTVSQLTSQYYQTTSQQEAIDSAASGVTTY